MKIKLCLIASIKPVNFFKSGNYITGKKIETKILIANIIKKQIKKNIGFFFYVLFEIF